jgi:hypothetical protein
MEKEFYKCKLSLKKISFDSILGNTILLFMKDKIYEALDTDDKSILLKAENGEYMVIEGMKLGRHFKRVNIMPRFPKEN